MRMRINVWTVYFKTTQVNTVSISCINKIASKSFVKVWYWYCVFIAREYMSYTMSYYLARSWLFTNINTCMFFRYDIITNILYEVYENMRRRRIFCNIYNVCNAYLNNTHSNPSKIEKVPRGIQGEKSRKDSVKLVSTIVEQDLCSVHNLDWWYLVT